MLGFVARFLDHTEVSSLVQLVLDQLPQQGRDLGPDKTYVLETKATALSLGNNHGHGKFLRRDLDIPTLLQNLRALITPKMPLPAVSELVTPCVVFSVCFFCVLCFFRVWCSSFVFDACNTSSASLRVWILL